MSKRGFLDISFSWVFAILIGAFILFLAIYGVTKFTKTASMSEDLELSKEISFLLNPLETGFEQGIMIPLKLPTESRIKVECDDFSEQGFQEIIIQQEIYNKWTDTNTGTKEYNKYLFTDGFVQGKKFYLFSQPFEFPFKISNLIYLTSSDKEYCFTGTPNSIEDELSKFNQSNIFLENCESPSRISICFGQGNSCDINVNTIDQSIKKFEEETIYYSGNALLYAGIFSDSFSYECHLNRLMKRATSLTKIYQEKATIHSRNNCDSYLSSDLGKLEAFLGTYSNSKDLKSIEGTINQLKGSNQHAECKLW